MSKQIFILALAVLAILTSNMYVAAIPIIQHALQTSTHAIQLTISFYMLGLFLGILFYGPLSDEYGRKPVLLIGLTLFTIGVVLSAFSTNITLFSLSRFIQAFGAASALSLWQAIAIDTYRDKAGQVIATGYMAIGFVPALSPLIGSFLTAHLGWKSIFVVLTIYGLIIIASTFLQKNLASRRINTTESTHWSKRAAHNYFRLLQSPQFILLTLFSATLYSMIYIFMAETPTLLHNLGYGTNVIGIFFAPISVAFIVGSFSARHFLKKKTPSRYLLMLGILITLLGASLQVLLNAFNLEQSWQALIAPFTLMTVGTGVMLPVVVAKAMSLFTENAGLNAAMIGALQNLIAFALSALGALFSQFGALGLTLSLCLITLILLSKGSWILKKKYV